MKARAKKAFLNLTLLFLICPAYCVFVYCTDLYIPCIFRLLTGLKCPGCGISHMLINLLHFNFKAAFKSNQLLFITFPIIISMIIREIYCYIKYGNHKTDKWIKVTSFVLIALFIAFTLLRNIFKF